MTRSEALYRRALELMPWGTQTNAKRPDLELAGVMPFFIDRAEGCRICDVDDRWFIDYRMALGPILLGYRHPAVEEAVRAQQEKGVLFSMASPVEIEAAERLVDMVPGLEQVRFMKTGNGANLAALRLARAYTGRDHVVTCGYHGHGDWFACGRGEAPGWWSSEITGVPRALDELVTRLAYGDAEGAERVFAERGAQIAAVIMVPYDWGETADHAFVHRMRALTERHGAVLIFDEVLTGFRLAMGGAREYFGVVPELSVYAKAVANGYPLSAYGGRRDVMAMLDQVTLTTTYAGETLSLAAARASLDVIQAEPVVEHIWAMGERLRQGFDAAARARGLPFRAYGLPPAVQFRFADDPETDAALRRAFFRELYTRGIFASVPFLLSYAHDEGAIDETVEAFRSAMIQVEGLLSDV